MIHIECPNTPFFVHLPSVKKSRFGEWLALGNANFGRKVAFVAPLTNESYTDAHRCRSTRVTFSFLETNVHLPGNPLTLLVWNVLSDGFHHQYTDLRTFAKSKI